MEKQVLVQKLFNTIELAIAVLFLFKITASCVFYKIKKHAKTTPQFWMYLFFAISYLCYILCHICTTSPDVHVVVEAHLNPMSIQYFQNIFYTGSLLYLQIYIYKLITFVDTENIYTGNAHKKRKQLTRLQNVIYVFSILLILTQVVMIGMVPYFFMSSRVSPEIVSTFCVLFSLITVSWFLLDLKLFRSVVSKWIYYEMFSLIVLPYSYILNLLEPVLSMGFVENGMIIAIALRAPFLAVRSCQFVILIASLFTLKDVRLLYD